MNTSKKSKIRNFICSIIATFAFILSSVSLLNFNKNFNSTYAAVDLSNKMEIENSNFTKDSDNIFPIKSITGFKAYSDNVEATEKNPNCGVIDLSDDDYSTRFAIAKENREGLDNQVLMLTSESSNINFGYRTTKTIEMKANSNYMITVDVFTEQNASIGNISLYNGKEVFSEIKNINSNNTWITYHLFVKTAEESVNLNLGLNITNKGTVLFDNIACYQVNNETLSEMVETQKDLIKNDETLNGYSNIKYSYQNEVNAEHKVINYTASNDSFFDGTNYIELENTNFVEGENDTDYTEISTVFDSDGTNNKAIKINNKQKTFVEYTAENLLTFEV